MLYWIAEYDIAAVAIMIWCFYLTACLRSVTRTDSIAFKRCLMWMVCNKNQHHCIQAMSDVDSLWQRDQQHIANSMYICVGSQVCVKRNAAAHSQAVIWSPGRHSCKALVCSISLETLGVWCYSKISLKKKRRPQAAELANVTVYGQFTTQQIQHSSLKMMNNHPFATHTQRYVFDLHVLSLRPAYILGQYLLRAKAGRDHSPRFCCFLPSGSPTGSTSALHPHPTQAPQNWPCRTSPGQLLSVPKCLLRSVHSTVKLGRCCGCFHGPTKTASNPYFMLNRYAESLTCGLVWV